MPLLRSPEMPKNHSHIGRVRTAVAFKNRLKSPLLTAATPDEQPISTHACDARKLLVKFFTRCRLTLPITCAQYAFGLQTGRRHSMPADQPSGRRLPIGLMVAGSEMASFTLLGLLL